MLFPIFANLEGRNVLVAGGGDVAQRKIEALLKAGARIHLYAKTLNNTLSAWLEDGRLHRLQGPFEAAWLDDVWLVVAATDDRNFNRELAAEASRRKRLINVVDDAELSSFHVPAIVGRDPLQIAISSGGSAPMLARRLRERLETDLDESLGTLASLFASNRDAIRRQWPDLKLRRRWFDQVLDGPIVSLLQRGEIEAANEAFSDSLATRALSPVVSGRIIVIDVNHCDPALLTLQALRAMNVADLLVCDSAVTQPLRERARRDADSVDAPKDDATLITLLVESAQAGLCVVFLEAGELVRTERKAALQSACMQSNVVFQILASVSTDG